MARIVKAGETWTTFVFDGVDCADMGVYCISNGGTYTQKMSPSFQDTKIQVSSYDGQYYYGTQLTSQTFILKMFADELTTKELIALKTWLNPKHIGKIIFSDQPFKYYYVKVSSIEDLNGYPLKSHHIQTHQPYIDEEEPIYVGEFGVTFETVGSPYGYGISYYKDGRILYDNGLLYDDGLLYMENSPKMEWDIHNGSNIINIYNPGEVAISPNLVLSLGDQVLDDNAKITITNETTKDYCNIALDGLSGEVTLNLGEQTVSTENGVLFGRYLGSPITISQRVKNMILIPETYYDESDEENKPSIVVENNGGIKINNPNITLTQDGLIGQNFCYNFNGGSKINSVDITNRIIHLVDTDTIDPTNSDGYYECNLRRKSDGIEGVAYDSLEEVQEIENPNIADVALVIKNEEERKSEWYIYRNGNWELTTLFTSIDQFRDEWGNYVPYYLICSGAILSLDNITINSNINGTFKMKAQLIPRYL